MKPEETKVKALAHFIFIRRTFFCFILISDFVLVAKARSTHNGRRAEGHSTGQRERAP